MIGAQELKMGKANNFGPDVWTGKIPHKYTWTPPVQKEDKEMTVAIEKAKE